MAPGAARAGSRNRRGGPGSPQLGSHERHLGVGGSASQLEFDAGIEQLDTLVAAETGTSTRPVSRA